MGPKVESALRFLHAGGHEVIITSYEHLCEAIHGSAGTRIFQNANLREHELKEPSLEVV
jgi:carbamate kinase